MNTTTLGVFKTQTDAENAINEMSRIGFSSKDISIVTKDQNLSKKENNSNVASGATTGGLLGGLAGLLVGIGTVVIPGFGGIFIAGPLTLGISGGAATAVSGALTGIFTGGLLGGLIGLGLPEETAQLYEDDIKDGAILLGVPTTDLTESKVRNVLEENHGKNVRTINNNKSENNV